MSETRWSNEFLDSMRRVGDPLADETIEFIFTSGDYEDISNIMRTLVENDDFPTAHLPPAVEKFMQESSHLPDWADKDLLRAGSRLFNRYGPEIVLMLFGASLPILYAAHPGCEVLVATARMTKNIHRRIIETGQFVIDVTDENAWGPHGRGILTTQKVRLMHAATRHFLTKAPHWQDHWKEEWLVPICQEDLMGTMLSFSVTVLQSLISSNITLNSDEKEAYLHLWKVICYIMGVDERLMPDHYDEAEALLNQWMRRNHRPSAAGRELMKAMVDFWYLRVPGRLFDGATSGHARMWIGDELSDQLGIPPFDWTVNLLKFQHFIWKYEDWFEDRFVPYQWFTRFWTRRFMKALMSIERGGKRPEFRIPDHLQEIWGLK